MIRIENAVFPSGEQWESVVRGVRNPFDSWDKSDSGWVENSFTIGPSDRDLMQRLANAGDDHGKFLRMLPVIMDITAPFYFWKQADTYKVGTVANSCSTMHRIMAKPFTVDDFSWEHTPENVQDNLLSHLNLLRRQYLEETAPLKKQDYWFQTIEFLPDSYNQKRTFFCNYQTLKHIYHDRKGHKLPEWETLRKWIEEVLPFAELITGKES